MLDQTVLLTLAVSLSAVGYVLISGRLAAKRLCFVGR